MTTFWGSGSLIFALLAQCGKLMLKLNINPCVAITCYPLLVAKIVCFLQQVMVYLLYDMLYFVYEFGHSFISYSWWAIYDDTVCVCVCVCQGCKKSNKCFYLNQIF